MEKPTSITVEVTVNVPIGKAWDCFTLPEHITNWNHASDDWHCPRAENDLRTGGSFSSTMAAKDGSFSFDFEGIYSDVQVHKRIAYDLADGRTVEILFSTEGDATRVTETFDAENENPIQMQKDGWQAILDNYKKHAEQFA